MSLLPCETCRYWVRLNPEVEGLENGGTCHIRSLPEWPWRGHADGCGEHRPNDEDETAEVTARLTKELERAYRALTGLSGAALDKELPDQTMWAYHSLVIAAARRFVFEGELDGAAWFEGQHYEVMQEFLRPRASKDDQS
jgi:hypothetical protein